MSKTAQIAGRLRGMVRRHNFELWCEAVIKSLLGIVFTAIVFGAIFGIGWFVGQGAAPMVGLHAWHFGAILAGIFLLVATWSAWRRVNPLAGLQRSSDGEELLSMISRAVGGVPYINPRHATATAAMVLLGGPANMLQAMGAVLSRIRASRSLLDEASQLLTACRETCPIESVHEPSAALLLGRLALIKVIPDGNSSALTLTDKGRMLFLTLKRRGRKRPTEAGYE